MNRVYPPQDVMRSVEATRKEPISRWVVKLIRMPLCAAAARCAAGEAQHSGVAEWPQGTRILAGACIRFPWRNACMILKICAALHASAE